MRYQIFNCEADSLVKPKISAPWKWLALFIAARCSHNWHRCRVIDSDTGTALVDWARAKPAITFSHAMASTEHAQIDSITQAAIFRCNLPGLCVLYGTGTVVLDPKVGDSIITRNILIASGNEIVPVMELAQTLRDKGIKLNGVALGQYAVSNICNGQVVDEVFDSE